MTIQRLQITPKQEEYEVKVLYAPKSKERTKKEVRKDVAEILDIIAWRLLAAKKPETDGGQSGFWKDGRVEEIVVSKGGKGM